MKGTEINEVFEKVDELFKIHLKAQIKGTEIFFTKLLNVENLITNQKYYLLFLSDYGINFTNQNELLEGLKNFINKELETIKNEVQNYQYHMIKDLVYDEEFIHLQLDGLGYKESKLVKLKSKIDKQLLAIKND